MVASPMAQILSLKSEGSILEILENATEEIILIQMIFLTQDNHGFVDYGCCM